MPSTTVTAEQMDFSSDSLVAPKGSCTITLDYPICEDNEVKGHILDYLRDSLVSIAKYAMIPTELHDLPDIHEVSIDSFMRVVANQIATSYSNDAIESLASWEDMEEMPIWMSARDCDITIKIEADNAAYTSYTIMVYAFCGGAHASYFIVPTTIRKDNGKAVSNIMRRDKEKDMQTLLWQLVADADSTGEYKGIVAEYLGLIDTTYVGDPFLGLPSQEPWLAPDGVHLQYQPYEITPWVYGSPTFVIPIDKAKPYISNEAFKLLTQDNNDGHPDL